MVESRTEGQWLSFSIDNECYVHEVASIKSIVLYDRPQEVPGAIEGMEGILNVRGEPVSIFSGRNVLGVEPEEAKDQWRIILFEYPEGSFGLIVDSVDALVKFPEDQIDRNVQQSDSPLIEGTVHFDQQLMIVLNCRDASQSWLRDQ